MFGYVVANIDKLSPEELRRYRSCYCGLCKALGDRHGTLSRATINYDMAFLVLLLSSAYEADSVDGTERCVVHPAKAHPYWRNGVSDYAADINIALAYYSALDDWNDDKDIPSLLEAKALEREYGKVADLYPRQCSAIRESVRELSAIEKAGELNPDVPARCVGRLMGEAFAMRDDDKAEGLRAFGNSLGKFIYIMDACLDIKRDLRKQLYNPMVATESARFRDILRLLMADCAEKYEALAVTRDKKLIENILYSGVWTAYEARNKKNEESEAR